MWEVATVGLFVCTRGACMHVGQGGSRTRVCCTNTPCVLGGGSRVKWTLSFSRCDSTNSGGGESPASRRPNEEGVVLLVQWESEGEVEEIRG